MPETLYNSVKASVVEYQQIKKHNERAEDKSLFRWKLLTIFLGIVLILLVGLFSQFLKSLNAIPDHQFDYSYVVPLLRTVSDSNAGDLSNMANIVAGVAAGAKQNSVNFEYNAAEQIFSSTNGVVVNDLVKAIKDQKHLLFLFNTVYNEVQMRFGLYAHKGYTQYQSNGGNEDVPIEADGQQFSTIFNVNVGTTFLYQITSCNLFHLFQNNQKPTLELFSIVDIDDAGISFDAFEFKCLADKNGQEGDLATGRQRMTQLTGIGSDVWPEKLYSFGMEVYKLYLNEQK